MKILREIDTELTYSFYLEGDVLIGVWQDSDSRLIQYYRYADGYKLGKGSRGRKSNEQESSELEFLICFGREAKEVYEKGLGLGVGEYGSWWANRK